MPTPAAPPRPFRAAGATEAMRAAALGVNLWVIALVLPVAHAGAPGVLGIAALLVPLVPLAIGALALAANGRPGRRALAIGMLLFGFPVALAGVIAARADLADRDAWGALGLFVGAVSLLAYGAVAIEACGRPLRLRSSTASGLGTPLVAREPAGRAWLRRIVLATAALGGLLAAVVAPALGTRATLVRTWGEAADEATVLASIIGAGASAIALAGLIGPRLRAPRAGEAPTGGSFARGAIALGIAALALTALVILRHLET